jgi:phosphatidylserine decarboxylase
MPIAREGWMFIGVFVGLAALAAVWGASTLAIVLLLLGLFVAYFFRDPERTPPGDPRLVLSPADGKVVRVGEAPAGALTEGAVQVSIFLSIFDVHVNRAPIAGRIAGIEYKPGAFLPAFDEKASEKNEQNKVTLDDGRVRLAFTQIAGLIARRIVFRKKLDDAVLRGERVGLIKFGSRVDVFLAKDVKILVRVGDRVQGGLSAIGELP